MIPNLVGKMPYFKIMIYNLYIIIFLILPITTIVTFLLYAFSNKALGYYDLYKTFDPITFYATKKFCTVVSLLLVIPIFLNIGFRRILKLGIVALSFILTVWNIDKLSFWMGVPYPFQIESLPNGDQIILAIEHPLSEGYLSLYKNTKSNDLVFEKVGGANIINDGPNSEEWPTMILTKDGRFILVKRSIYWSDCFKIESNPATKCIANDFGAINMENTKRISSLVKLNP